MKQILFKRVGEMAKQLALVEKSSAAVSRRPFDPIGGFVALARFVRICGSIIILIAG
jgi:hypothetical protein